MTTTLLPFRKAVEGFLLARAADGYSPATIDQYEWALERLADRVGEKKVGEVTTSDIRRFIVFLREEYIPNRSGGNDEPLSDTSIFHAWKAVRAFYKWASPELGIENVAAKIAKPAHAEKEVIPFSVEDIKKLIKACEYTAPAKTKGRRGFQMKRPTAGRDRAIILTLLDTGMRVSELCELDVISYEQVLGELHVTPRGAGYKSKARTLPLGKAAKKALWLYLSQRECELRDPLFVTKRETRMSRSEVLYFCKRLGERAGVYRCYPHRFRHTFAIMFLRNGGDVYNLQRMLGHTTLQMVQKYLALSKADTATAHRRASPVDNIRGL